MKTKSLLLIVTLLLGCGLNAQNSEDTKQQIQRIKTWQADVGWKFNRSALHDFLKSCITERKAIDSVDISKIPVGDNFVRSGGAYYYTGSWVFITKDEDNKTFEFRTKLGKAGWAVFLCERADKKHFKLVKAFIDSSVPSDGNPYPNT